MKKLLAFLLLGLVFLIPSTASAHHRHVDGLRVELSPMGALAAPAALDRDFGDDGLVTLPGRVATDVAIQPDGKIVVGGDGLGVARLLPGGGIDTSFGGGDGRTAAGRVEAVELQSDGKIVAAAAGERRSKLLRFDDDGTPDASFSEDGVAIIPFGGRYSAPTDIAIRQDGKIVVAGLLRCCPFHRTAVARFNSNGEIDDTFGEDGSGVVTPRGVKLGISLALQADGKIVLAGLGFRVMRLTAKGRVDSTFGDGGVSAFARRRRASDVALQPDGAIVVAGYVGRFDRKFLVTRLNADGTPDEEFGGDGSKRTNIGPFEDEARSAVVQPDGKIVVVGWTRNLSVSGPDDFAIVRYLPGGRLDPSFGTGGILRSDFHSGLSERAGRSALQPDGKIVVVGLAFIRPTVGRSAVARYLG